MEKLIFYRDDRMKKWGFVSSLIYSNGLWMMPIIGTALTGVDPVIGLTVGYGCMGSMAIYPDLRGYLLKADRFFRSYWKKYRKSMRVSEQIKSVLEASGLVMIEKKEDKKRRAVKEITIYPKTEIYCDTHSYYIQFEMMPGQISKQWETKSEAFAHALKGDLTNFKVNRGIVILEVFVGQLEVDGVLYKRDNEHYINIGVGQSEVLKWEFDEVPHLLLIGMTGSGKSTFVRNLLVQMSDDWTVDIIDGKYVEFSFLRNYGYNVASEPSEFKAYINKAQAEVDKRFKEMEALGVNNYNKTNHKPYILLIDEFIFVADAFKSKKDRGEEFSEREVMFDRLRDIALRGRAAGVFMILILQRPDSTYLPTVIRDNMVKVVLGAGSETAFEMAFGSDKKKLAGLPKGMGYFQSEGDVKFFGFANYEMEEYMKDLSMRRSPVLTQRKEKKVVPIKDQGDIVSEMEIV